MEEHIRALLQRLALADVLQLRVAQLLVAAPEADGRDLAPEWGAVGAHQAGFQREARQLVRPQPILPKAPVVVVIGVGG